MVELKNLERAIRRSWSKATSSNSDWNQENPAWGQCAVTSLVVQDYLQGDIVWANVVLPEKEVSHYFNNVDGKEIDLTREQFPPGTQIAQGVPKTKQFRTTREYIMSYPQTVERYNILRQRVEGHLI